MNDYEAKQEARRERLEAAAERQRRKAARAMKASDDATAGIPPGQPILVGHHSERRHRRALDRSWTKLGEAVEAERAAKDLASRAAAVGTGGVSSDDPEAVEKLREKLAEMEERQAQMKRVNAAHKKAGAPKADDEAGLRAMLELLEERDHQAAARGLRTLQLCPYHGRPFPSYALSNNNANMRRVKQRIETLAAPRYSFEEESGETPAGEAFRIVAEDADNRVAVYFDGKPSEGTRRELKRYGFRWNRTLVAWTRMLNSSGHYAARYACGVQS